MRQYMAIQICESWLSQVQNAEGRKLIVARNSLGICIYRTSEKPRLTLGRVTVFWPRWPYQLSDR